MKPLTALIAATHTIASEKSPHQIELPHAPPEIEELGEAFNNMSRAIQQRDLQIHRQTSEKLMRSDRLAMIGQLAAGVAHEINNPLGSILLFSRLIMQQVPAEGRVRENLERIEKETKRCHTIVKSLLDFARERKPTGGSLDVNQLLDATLKLFEGQFLFQNIQIVKDYDRQAAHDPGGPVATAAGLHEHHPERGGRDEAGKGSLVLMTRRTGAERTVEISISDTGCGIPPENIDASSIHSSPPKGVGHGTGLGLSVSYGIIQSHNGDIRVSRQSGCRRYIHHPSAGNKGIAVMASRGKVLIIDDDESMRLACAQTLEQGGFSVALAADGGRRPGDELRANRSTWSCWTS